MGTLLQVLGIIFIVVRIIIEFFSVIGEAAGFKVEEIKWFLTITKWFFLIAGSEAIINGFFLIAVGTLTNYIKEIKMKLK